MVNLFLDMARKTHQIISTPKHTHKNVNRKLLNSGNNYTYIYKKQSFVQIRAGYQKGKNGP